MSFLLLERMDSFTFCMLASQEELTAFCKLTNAFFHFNIDVLKDSFLPEDIWARWRERLIISRCSLLTSKKNSASG